MDKTTSSKETASATDAQAECPQNSVNSKLFAFHVFARAVEARQIHDPHRLVVVAASKLFVSRHVIDLQRQGMLFAEFFKPPLVVFTCL